MLRVLEKRTPFVLAVLLSVLVISSVLFLGEPRTVHSASSNAAINGYAWSDNIGWIDLNCSNSQICGSNPFGLSINSSGVLSGYAWSDNIGWVSANSSDLVGCPSAPCTATITGSTFSGWLKALAADNNGWDGWISLSGTSPDYGVTETAGVFSGYAWGDAIVGWLDLRYATTTYNTCTASTTYTCSGQTIVKTDIDTNCNATVTNITPACSAPSFCSAGSSVCLYPTPVATGPLTVTPQLTPSGGSVGVSWNISNVVSCTVSADVNADSWSGASSGATPKTSSPILQQTTYTLSCVQDDPAAPAFTESAVVNIVPKFQER